MAGDKKEAAEKERLAADIERARKIARENGATNGDYLGRDRPGAGGKNG